MWNINQRWLEGQVKGVFLLLHYIDECDILVSVLMFVKNGQDVYLHEIFFQFRCWEIFAPIWLVFALFTSHLFEATRCPDYDSYDTLAPAECVWRLQQRQLRHQHAHYALFHTRLWEIWYCKFAADFNIEMVILVPPLILAQSLDICSRVGKPIGMLPCPSTKYMTLLCLELIFVSCSPVISLDDVDRLKTFWLRPRPKSWSMTVLLPSPIPIHG